MEDIQSFRENTDAFPATEAFKKLKEIAEILREMGFDVTDRLITMENITRQAPFPIVSDGLDGIRATYSRRDGLKVWFTNGFQERTNPQRQEIERKLREVGLQ